MYVDEYEVRKWRPLKWACASPDHLHVLRDGTSVYKNTTSLPLIPKVETTHLISCFDILVQTYRVSSKNQLSTVCEIHCHTFGQLFEPLWL